MLSCQSFHAYTCVIIHSGCCWSHKPFAALLSISVLCRIIATSFNNDKTFQNVLNHSFESFINLSQRSPEFISLFMDDKLRKGLKGMTDNDIESVLDKVMMLFRYLQEKDVFEKYYKQHLAKRLLSGRTVSPCHTCGMQSLITSICPLCLQTQCSKDCIAPSAAAAAFTHCTGMLKSVGCFCSGCLDIIRSALLCRHCPQQQDACLNLVEPGTSLQSIGVSINHNTFPTALPNIRLQCRRQTMLSGACW